MARASPTSAAMCRSWPQACMTGTSFPFGSVPVARLAYGRPVASSTGKRVHVGPDEERRPVPVLEHGRDAVPANPRWTVQPTASSASASRSAVPASCPESSGCAWSVR